MITKHTLGFPHSKNQLNTHLTMTMKSQQQADLDYISIGDTRCADPLITMMDLLGHRSARKHFTPYKMAKWFANDADYIVPEFSQKTRFALNADSLIHQVKLARESGINVKPILIGPITYLWSGEVQDDSKKLDLLDDLLPVYADLLQKLADSGVEWVQIDEPVFTQSLDEHWTHAIQQSYYYLQRSPIKTLLATYSGSIETNLKTLCELTVDGIHIETVTDNNDVDNVIDWLAHYKVLSLGVEDGTEETLRWLKPIYALLQQRLWLAPACGLSKLTIEKAQQEINEVVQHLTKQTKQTKQKIVSMDKAAA